MTDRIRVLHVVEDHDSIGGAEELVTTLVTALQATKQVISEVALVAPNRLAAKLQERNIIVHSLREERAVRRPIAQRLGALVTSGRFDIVQSHLLKMNTLNALATSGHTAKTVGTCHGLLAQELTLRSRCYGFWAGRKLDTTVCVSHALARQFEKVYLVPKSKVSVVPNAYDPGRLRVVTETEKDAFRIAHGFEGSDNIVLAIGNVSPAKEYGDLIDAITIPIQDHRELTVRLVIAGATRQPLTDALKSQAEVEGISDRVTFLGEFRDISLLFAVAKVYVSSSYREGFSLTTVEAMAAGIPVVVTDSGGPPEIIDYGRCGRVVPFDFTLLGEAIVTALTETEQTEMLAIEAKKRVAAEYTPSIMSGRYLALYQSLLSRK